MSKEEDLLDVKCNTKFYDIKKINKHKKNLFPYFSNHFMHCLKYNSEFQKYLRDNCKVSNPVFYIVKKINEYKISNKKSLLRLVNLRDGNINLAISIWLRKYLIPLMNISK